MKLLRNEQFDIVRSFLWMQYIDFEMLSHLQLGDIYAAIFQINDRIGSYVLRNTGNDLSDLPFFNSIPSTFIPDDVYKFIRDANTSDSG